MTAAKWHLWGLVTVLTLLGLGIASYRHLVLTVPLNPNHQLESWSIDARLSFEALPNQPVKASFQLPYRPPGFAILDEFFVGNHYGVTTNLERSERKVVWSKRRASGEQSLYYRAIVQKTQQMPPRTLPQPFLPPIVLSEAQHSAVATLAQLARKTSADIQTFAQETVKLLHTHQDSVRLLLKNNHSESAIVSTAILVLKHAHIKAMPVNGLVLSSKPKTTLSTCLLIWVDDRPVFINAKDGDAHLPADFLVWSYGSPPLFELIGGHKPHFRFAISPTSTSALEGARYHGQHMGSLLMRLSLQQLPLGLQQTYRVLFTLPLGALVMVILRQYVGLTTFGTFMPVLIALAFRQTHLVWGLVFFTLLVAVGLLVRFYFNQLRLLAVPRLASILTVVVMLMAFTGILSQQVGLESGLSVALFPMVIITMIIERMCVMWDERGAASALLAGLGSLLAAALCFSVMNQPLLQYWLVAFPELLLLVLAMILTLGQYRGYRLSEWWRFGKLVEG